ncbi:CPBP family intramembrane metalloprotease [Treponema socranskii]|uniref:CPBP family intramembrane glutamic endopeptidase n=1 Tax=Treponema socranskii TaxID=53419 RepID=UPI003D9303CF
MEISENLRRNAVFAASLCLFVIPPLFPGSAPTRAFSSWTFPIKPLCYAAIAFTLLRFSFPPSAERSKADAFRFVQTGWAIASFGSLCVIASVVELAVRFSGGKANLHPSLPSSIAETFFCIANFACASFYEEAIYRLYLPEMLGAVLKDVFLKSKNNDAETKKEIAASEEAVHKDPVREKSAEPAAHESAVRKENAESASGENIAGKNTARKKRAETAVRISETLSVIAFALSHRYLGLPSVVNAFFAGIMLRICCKKSGTLWTNTAAHFAYNMLSLVLFAHMQ